MCGRFALVDTPDAVKLFMGLDAREEFPPRYNIAPTQPVLLVTAAPSRAPGSNLPDRCAMLVRWGLIPGWAKAPQDLPLLFNARSETAAEKASFRAAMRHRRALIPASGFYEWKRQGRSRAQAYWVRPRGGGLVAFAALMETWSEPGGSEIDTGAILTTEANGLIAHIHPRMPVIVRPPDFSRWLDCAGHEPREVSDLMRPVEPDFLEAIPISEKVNKVENAGPEIQEPAEAGDADSASQTEPPAQMRLF